jgi:hypothetical protein
MILTDEKTYKVELKKAIKAIKKEKEDTKMKMDKRSNSINVQNGNRHGLCYWGYSSGFTMD